MNRWRLAGNYNEGAIKDFGLERMNLNLLRILRQGSREAVLSLPTKGEVYEYLDEEIAQ